MFVMAAGRRCNIIHFIEVISHFRTVIPGMIANACRIFRVHAHAISIAVIGIAVIIGVIKTVSVRAKILAAAD